MLQETPHPNIATIVTGHFDEGAAYANWRAHGTPDYLLLFSLAGAGRIGHGGGELVSRRGDLVLLRPNTLHDYGTARGAAGWELLWAHFLPHPHWLPTIAAWPERAPSITVISLGDPDAGADTTVAARVRDALFTMHHRALSGIPRRDDFARCALEEALLWADSAIAPDRNAPRRDLRVARAAELLLERMALPVDFARTAEIVGLSTSRLGHLFREQMGVTPQQFLEDARMARARQLLSLTDRTVAVIATEVGYENPFYFTLRFKRQTGLSPREWRRGQRGPL